MWADELFKLLTRHEEGGGGGKGKGRGGSNGPGWWKFCAIIDHGNLWDDKIDDENCQGSGGREELELGVGREGTEKGVR